MFNQAVLFDAERGVWIRYRDPRQVITTARVNEVSRCLAQVETFVEQQHLTAVGFLAYEAAPALDSALLVKELPAFPLLWFGLYDQGEVIPRPARKAPEPLAPSVWHPTMTQESYFQVIQAIKRYIQQGETYQVNFTFRLHAPFPADPWDLFLALLPPKPPPYSAFLLLDSWAILSFSPELFFELSGTHIISRPMKGTAPRGLTWEDDQRQAAQLRHSPKDQAENVMIVDMVRNDLGKIARWGTVNVKTLFATEKYPTVWQMTSTVEAQTEASFSQIIGALFPPASITGAPKPRTMAIIAELETTPRRLYTGCIGVYRPGRQARFNVAIRTLLVDPHQATVEYGVGGGVVWDSDPQAEWNECFLKARQLTARPNDFALLETMLWRPGQGYFLLEEHLARLSHSASYFDFNFHAERIRQALTDAAMHFGRHCQRVRLLMDRVGQIQVQSHEYVPETAPHPKRVCLAPKAIDATDVFLYHKTTHRLLYEQMLKLCPGYDDVILWNEQEQVTESCVANLIVELHGRRYTPPVACGLLPGVSRQWLLAQGQIQEKILSIDELKQSQRIILINSVRGEQRAELSQ